VPFQYSFPARSIGFIGLTGTCTNAVPKLQVFIFKGVMVLIQATVYCQIDPEDHKRTFWQRKEKGTDCHGNHAIVSPDKQIEMQK
jgi:hypothetical protein